MALKLQKTLTNFDLTTVSGDYWRIANLYMAFSPSGENPTGIQLEFWVDHATREAGESDPLKVIKLDAPNLLESRAEAYEWLKNNVAYLSGAEDI